MDLQFLHSRGTIIRVQTLASTQKKLTLYALRRDENDERYLLKWVLVNSLVRTRARRLRKNWRAKNPPSTESAQTERSPVTLTKSLCKRVNELLSRKRRTKLSAIVKRARSVNLA